MSIYETSKPASTVTHFLQQGHTYSNKATPPNCATPYMPSIQTHESVGAISSLTTAGGLVEFGEHLFPNKGRKYGSSVWQELPSICLLFGIFPHCPLGFCVYTISSGAVQVGSDRVTKIRKATLVPGLPFGWSSLLPCSPRPLGMPLLMTFAVDNGYLSCQPYGLQ